MLARLSIRDIVLIDAIDLDFDGGFTVLTGETGAGKSILLDAFALALGARGDAGLVRNGAEQGQVTAAFELAAGHPAMARLHEAGFEGDGTLILRRVQSTDGRTKAFINDQPASVQLLRDVGAHLVEIHGQHDERALVDTAVHRGIVDAYGQLGADVTAVREAHARMRSAARELKAAEDELDQARRDADYLKHAAEELETIDPQADEEETLATRRQALMGAEKIAGDLQEAHDALAGSDNPATRVATILRKLERRGPETEALLAPLVQAMSQALDAMNAAREKAEGALAAAAFDPHELENIEERLFALRALARKHNITVAQLPELRTRISGSLAALDAGEERLAGCRAAHEAAQADYATAAKALSTKRTTAAEKLDAAVNTELPDLKLERARFFTTIQSGDPATGSADGVDQVIFAVQTNPGSQPGPLMKVASGGELSRFLLALKVALAGQGGAPTLVFDEIDAAMSGAVSQAIGQRLERLAQDVQVLAVTHAPQVAARAAQHFLIGKAASDDGKRVATDVSALDDDGRSEEVARMLAGASVTDEARAAARRLIQDQPA